MNSVLAVLFACAAALGGGQPPFAFREIGPTKLELSENGKPVFVYNFGMVVAPGFPESMKRSSYLHPVFGRTAPRSPTTSIATIRITAASLGCGPR